MRKYYAVLAMLAVAAGIATVASCAPAGPGPAPGAGDAARGRTLLATRAQPACGTCHVIPGVEGAAGTVGPSLQGLATRAGTRVPGKSAEEYIRESILDPGAYLVEGFSNVMPSYRGQFSDQEMNDIVAFYMTLR